MVTFLRKSLIRTLIILFWTGILFAFLFFPRVGQLLREGKSITIFTFPLLIDAQYVSRFEARTGVKLHIHYYETNDALLAKLRSTDQHGYDIIFPSGYALEKLIAEGHLQKLDHSKLNFIDRINPQLKGLYYDPKNEYSTPYLWEVYGLGYDKRYFVDGPPLASWRSLFDETISPSHVGMLNNAREATAIAALYLFGKTENLTDEQLQQVQDLLISQKRRVSVYTDLRGDYLLLSKTAPLIACPAGDVWMAEDDRLDFLLPEEGSFVTVDNVCIPKESTNTELVYQFINFLYEVEVLKHHSDKYFFFPALTLVPFFAKGQGVMEHALRNFDTFHFFTPVASEKKLNDIWISLKGQ